MLWTMSELRAAEASKRHSAREMDEVRETRCARAAAVAARVLDRLRARRRRVRSTKSRRNFSRTSREARAAQRVAESLDAQLAAAERARPLVLAEDEDSEGVKASDVKPRSRNIGTRLRTRRAARRSSKSAARHRGAVAAALALKDAADPGREAARRRAGDAARDYQTFGDEIHAVMERRSEENPFARDDDRLEDALLRGVAAAGAGAPEFRCGAGAVLGSGVAGTF